MKSIIASVTLACHIWASPAAATEYGAIYVCLPDRGDLANVLGVRRSDPSGCRSSLANDSVTVGVLAAGLGLKADSPPWLSGFNDGNGLFVPGDVPGTNCAVADAMVQLDTADGSGGVNPPDHVQAHLDHVGQVADPDALCTMMVGIDDFANANREGGAADATPAVMRSAKGKIKPLIQAGAKKILIVNVLDVGARPAFAQSDQ